MIKDPDQKKPEDWVDNAKMDDPEDSKPEDWDKPEHIADPDATKPEDWDDEMDGEWEPPMIDNPEYKGEWKPRQIDNPDYKGAWVHPEIDNPDYNPADAEGIAKIKTTLATLDDLTKRMNYLRGQLYTLAEGTVRKVKQLIRFLKKFRDGGKLGKDYKTCLTLMKQLLSRSENVLVDAEKEIEQISKEMSITKANIVVFQGFVKQAKRKAAEVRRGAEATTTNEAIKKSVDIARHLTTSVTDGKWNTKANNTWADLAHGLLKSLPAVVELATVIDQYKRTPDLSGKFDEILEDLDEVFDKVHLESENIEKERKLVFAWKTEVMSVRQDWAESDDMKATELDEELVEVIIEDYTRLKDVAQNYVNHIDSIWDKVE